MPVIAAIVRYTASTGPSPVPVCFTSLAVDLHLHRRRRSDARAALGAQALQHIHLGDVLHLVGNERLEVLVVDLLLLVGQAEERLIDLLELRVGQFTAELRRAGGAARGGRSGRSARWRSRPRPRRPGR